MSHLHRNIIYFLMGIVASEALQLVVLRLMRATERPGLILGADIILLGSIIYYVRRAYPNLTYVAWGIGAGAVIFVLGIFLLI